jgi:hypothetical protein
MEAFNFVLARNYQGINSNLNFPLTGQLFLVFFQLWVLLGQNKTRSHPPRDDCGQKK